MSKVSIRTRPKKDGVMASIFLEFNPPLTDPAGLPVRYEFLDLEKYIKPANHIQKNFNIHSVYTHCSGCYSEFFHIKDNGSVFGCPLCARLTHRIPRYFPRCHNART